MQGSIKRLCALRKLQEDAESAELARSRTHLTCVEAAQDNESLRARSLAVSVHQQVCDGRRDDALTSEIELTLAPGRGRDLAALAEAARRQVQHAEFMWMESRRRRLETETLQAAVEWKRRAELDRREQQDMDEGFLLQSEQSSLRNHRSPSHTVRLHEGSGRRHRAF